MALSPVRPRASMSAGSADTIAFTRSYSPALIASMNAASVSGMRRLYLPALALLCTIAAAPVAAQTTPDRIERPPLGSTLTVDALGDLPSGGNLFTLRDTGVPAVSTDRVDTGGSATRAALASPWPCRERAY